MEQNLLLAVSNLRENRDVRALERIYLEFKKPVYNLCRRMTGNASDAEDLTQDVFVAVHGKIGTLREEEAFPGWLYRIAVNLCLDLCRARKRGREALAELGRTRDAAALPPAAPGPSGGLQERIQKAIDALPPDQRAAFLLGPVRRMPYARVAEALSCSVDAVKMRIHRARKGFLKTLGPLEGKEV